VKLESVYLFASCFPESCSADLVFRCTFLQLFFSSASMEIGEELGSALAAGGRNGGREGEVELVPGLRPFVLCSGSDLGFKCSFSCLYSPGPRFSRPVMVG
jgi:hypothetical protein